MKIPELEKWRFLICALHSTPGQATCSRKERQRDRVMAREEMASGGSVLPQSRKTTKDNRERLFTLFCYSEDTQNIFKINKVGLGKRLFTILTGIAFF